MEVSEPFPRQVSAVVRSVSVPSASSPVPTPRSFGRLASPRGVLSPDLRSPSPVLNPALLSPRSDALSVRLSFNFEDIHRPRQKRFDSVFKFSESQVQF